MVPFVKRSDWILRLLLCGSALVSVETAGHMRMNEKITQSNQKHNTTKRFNDGAAVQKATRITAAEFGSQKWTDESKSIKIVSAGIRRSQSNATFKAIMSTINSMQPRGFASSGTYNIQYHGGPVMLGTINVYYIWYGNWAYWNPGAKPLLENLAKNIGGSDYWNIQTTYFDSNGNHMSNSVSFKGSVTFTPFSYSLSDYDITYIVSESIRQTLPLDPNGVYFVLTSSDVDVENGGFCDRYCGWHTYRTISGQRIKYAFVGDAGRCPPGYCISSFYSCCAKQSPGPNGNTGADAMASVIAHELAEAATDPLLNAWYTLESDQNGNSQFRENGDTCSWMFGSTQGPSGQRYNVNLGGNNYLLQQNFIVTDSRGNGYCGLSVPQPKPTIKPSMKSRPPTRKPTRKPTFRPSVKPQPTKRPTVKPQPTKRPTVKPKPTKSPTVKPKPTKKPTKRPTRRPTRSPTMTPTSSPTTVTPTFSPTTMMTTFSPTSTTTTSSPTMLSTSSPTTLPTLTDSRTKTPTQTRNPGTSPPSSPPMIVPAPI